MENRLSPDEEAAVIEATRELLTDTANATRRLQPSPDPLDNAHTHQVNGAGGRREPLRVLGYAANGAADELALTMLAQAVDDLPIAIEITSERLLARLVSLVRTQASR